MNFGSSLMQARKRKGISQEEAAGRLGVSRQTISKWETGETVPDVLQCKKLSRMYGLTLDELVEFDTEVEEIEQMIGNTSEETSKKIDWTKLWAEKYPVLTAYQQEVDTGAYADALQGLLAKLEREQGYSSLDAMLVLKDILAHTWEG